jgi:hypothetical protein
MRIETIVMHVVLVGSIAMASCGAGQDSATDRAHWPSCSWPATLDPDPSGSARDHCIATRTLLSCSQPDGAGAICATNDPTQCADGNLPGAECHAECAQNEFTAMCGGVGPGPVPQPPAGCHPMVSVPSGVVFHCCPCGA